MIFDVRNTIIANVVLASNLCITLIRNQRVLKEQSSYLTKRLPLQKYVFFTGTIDDENKLLNIHDATDTHEKG